MRAVSHWQLLEAGRGLAGPRLAIPVWSPSIPSQAPLSECITDTERAEGKACAVLLLFQ